MRLADFYRALPIVSHSLFRAMHESVNIAEQIKAKPYRFLTAAKKLRNQLSFRDALASLKSATFICDSKPSILPGNIAC